MDPSPPPAGLVERLVQRRLLLTGSSRDLPPRQRTIGEAIAWSYDLLPPETQTMFRSLSVFTGGWTLAAAEAVVGVDGALDVLDGLQTIASASLVQAGEQLDGERRFTTLETMREFGLACLAASGEIEAVGQRHADYYLSFAQTGGAALAGASPGVSLGLLAAEEANLRSALA